MPTHTPWFEVTASKHATTRSYSGYSSGSARSTDLVLAFSGAAGAGPIRELDLEELRAGLEGKTLPYIACVQAALPKMTNNGSITMVTAGSAQSALPGTAGLAAVNGALEAAIRPLALELAPIRINAVSPGVIDSALVGSDGLRSPRGHTQLGGERQRRRPSRQA